MGSRTEAPLSAFSWVEDKLQLVDFDLGGVLYHAHYFRLYERVRERFLEHAGCPYPSLVEQHSHLAVTESHQRFLAPVRYGDVIQIKLWATELKRVSFVFHYEFELEEKCIHQGSTKHAFITLQNGQLRPATLPTKLQAALADIAV